MALALLLALLACSPAVGREPPAEALAAAAASHGLPEPAAFAEDDECQAGPGGSEHCALNALQHRATGAQRLAQMAEAQEDSQGKERQQQKAPPAGGPPPPQQPMEAARGPAPFASTSAQQPDQRGWGDWGGGDAQQGWGDWWSQGQAGGGAGGAEGGDAGAGGNPWGNWGGGGAEGGARRPRWRQLPGRFNFCVRYPLRPLYAGLTPASAAVLHYATAKPWDPEKRHNVHPAYVRLYLAFALAARVPWRAVQVAADLARDEEDRAKLAEIMAQA
mmetsp:Transcript_29383/g.88444  ORF Transcript_29383/g.88444 Transcript_29383/m.88444 type:complete len:275 (-) Transcript_29383:33-857(-)